MEAKQAILDAIRSKSAVSHILPEQRLQTALKSISGSSQSLPDALTRLPLSALEALLPFHHSLDRIGGKYSTATDNSQSDSTIKTPTDYQGLNQTSATNSIVRDVSDLGASVRIARKAKNLTQQDFADLAGVGRRFLSELEAGKPTLEIGKVLTVANAAGIQLMMVNKSNE